MQAMIMAAGMGTRLNPITLTKPKALVEVNGIPLLEIILERLKTFGFNRIVINTHHFPDQIRSFVDKKKNSGLNISISDETEMLMDTGGGLKKAANLFDNGPILVHNVDILTSLNLKELYDYHINSKIGVTLAVKERKTTRSLIIDDKGVLCGWTNHITGEVKRPVPEPAISTCIAFSAVHVVERSVLNNIAINGPFGIMDTYLNLAANRHVKTFRHDNDIWVDAGRIENLEEASKILPFVYPVNV